MPAAGDPHGHHVRRPRTSGGGHVYPPDYGVRDSTPGVRGGLAEGVAAGDAALGPQGQEEGDAFRRLPFWTFKKKRASMFATVY